MGKVKNITGNKFGKLTAIKIARQDARGRAFWLCRCNCGRERVVSLNSLSTGKIKSCGNILCKPPRYKNIIGKIFGKLYVEEMLESNEKGQRLWRCTCECGREVITNTHQLVSGHTTTCGNFPCRGTKKINLTGQRFGKLVVLQEIPRKNNLIFWECQCDCGNRTQVVSGSLLCGNTKSCGCYKIEQIKKARTKHGLAYTKEYAAFKARKRFELKKALDAGWSIDMENAIRKFFVSCVVCGMTCDEHVKKYKEILHVDHVLPLSKGNGLCPGNATILCRRCNDIKHARDLDKLSEEWQFKIIHSAYHFKCFWDKTNESEFDEVYRKGKVNV